MVALKEQVEQINTVIRKFDLFHDAYQNNFSVVLSNKYFSKEMYGDSNGDLFFGLNKANLNLQKLIGLCLEELKVNESQYGESSVNGLKQVHNVWDEFSRKGNQFLTYEPAEVLVKGLQLVGFPFFERLEEKVVVKEAFINLVPEEVKSLIRICLFVSDERTLLFLEELLAALKTRRELLYFIDRIEIAKQGFIRTNDDCYPTFNINFNPYFITNVRHPVIEDMLAFINSLAGCVSTNSASYPYYKKVGANIFLCQGFKNYKKFLSLLRIIDFVYDRESDYAFRLR